MNPTFSVRPRSSVGRVTVDLIRRSWVRFPPRSKDFFFTSCGSLIPLGLTLSGLFLGLMSTKIYTSELILCFTIPFYQFITNTNSDSELFSVLICGKSLIENAIYTREGLQAHRFVICGNNIRQACRNPSQYSVFAQTYGFYIAHL